MEEIDALIENYGLEEDQEHVIIPYTDKNGRKNRCYLLKRRYIRIVYSEDHAVDYPLIDAIEATIRYPELLLSEALYSFYKETDKKMPEGTYATKEPPKESDDTMSEENI
jgi:hypothetical protein